MYGLIKKEHLENIAKEVCDCLGYGSNGAADKLLLETAGAETGRGTIKDTSKGAGMGISQIDGIPFMDIKDRVRQEDKDSIKEYFDINIEWIEWEHLRYNPLLCMIFTRLKYKKIPEPIPNDLGGRARYWKEHYNTRLGKGTVSHYLEMNYR